MKLVKKPENLSEKQMLLALVKQVKALTARVRALEQAGENKQIDKDLQWQE